MGLHNEEEKAFEPAKRLFVLKAEHEARLAALEGGADWHKHLWQIKWLAAEIWEMERMLKSQRAAGERKES